MSFLAQKVPDTGMGAPERQAYDYQGPMPLPFGRFRIAMKLIEQPWNAFTAPTGKNQPEAQYYSLAGMFSHNIDAVDHILVNGRIVSTPYREYGDELDGADNPLPFFDLDIAAGYGGDEQYPLRIRFYWGREDQPADPFLTGSTYDLLFQRGRYQIKKNLSPAPNNHPPYSGLAYMIWYTYETGLSDNQPRSGGSALPNVEIIGYRKSKAWQYDGDNNAGVNPISICYDNLKNSIYGLGMPDDIIDPDDWEPVATYFNTNGYHLFPSGWDAGLSVTLAEARSAGEVLAKIAGHYDGFFVPSNGKLIPGYFGNRGDLIPDKATLLELTADHMIEFPEIKFPDAQGALTEASVKYKDNADDLADATVTERNSVPLLIRGDAKAETFDGPYYRTSKAARARAIRALSKNGNLRLVCKVFQSTLDNDGDPIHPGSLVVINYADLEIDLICRVVDRTDDDLIGSRLELISEPNGYDSEYTPPDEVVIPPTLEGPEEITKFRAIEIPEVFRVVPWPPAFWLIAARPNTSIQGAQVFRSADGVFDGEEERLDNLNRWAGLAKLNGTLPDSGVTSQVEIELVGVDNQIFRSPTVAEEQSRQYLLLVGDELLSYVVDTIDGDTLTLTVTRGLHGTTRTSHAVDADVYIFSPDEVHRYTMPNPPRFYSAGYFTHHLKLLAFTPFELGNAAGQLGPINATVPPAPVFVDWGSFAVGFDETRWMIVERAPEEYGGIRIVYQIDDAGPWIELDIIPISRADWDDVEGQQASESIFLTQYRPKYTFRMSTFKAPNFEGPYTEVVIAAVSSGGGSSS